MHVPGPLSTLLLPVLVVAAVVFVVAFVVWELGRGAAYVVRAQLDGRPPRAT